MATALDPCAKPLEQQRKAYSQQSSTSETCTDENADLLARLSQCLEDDDEPTPPRGPTLTPTAPVHSRPLPVPVEVASASLSFASLPVIPQLAAFKPKTSLWSLRNPGNLCFLNSLLQNLARLAPLMILLEAPQDGTRPAAEGTPLSSTFNHFCSKVNSEGTKCMQATKTTDAFHRVLPDLISPFSSGLQRQQDAHEVLLRLIEKLDLEGSSAGHRYLNPFAHGRRQHFGHPLPAVCSGLIKQEMTCTRCTLKSEQKESFLCLSIPIPVQPEVSVDSMMAAYFSGNEVQYRCSTCGSNAALVQQSVEMWPTVLIVHFLRWRGASKISTIIKIPPVWSLLADSACPKYKLNGYILHHGQRANVGHYTAVVRMSVNGTDQYHKISDDIIDAVPVERSLYSRDGFPSTTCYLAFYVLDK